MFHENTSSSPYSHISPQPQETRMESIHEDFFLKSQKRQSSIVLICKLFHQETIIYMLLSIYHSQPYY